MTTGNTEASRRSQSYALLLVTMLMGGGCNASARAGRAADDGGDDAEVLEETGYLGPRADAASDDAAFSTWAEACTSFAKAVCARAQACSAFSFAQTIGTTGNCEARYGGANCEIQMRSRGSVVTPEMVAACADAIEAQTCADRYVGHPAACAWQGSLADQSACTYDQQCQSERCDLVTGTWCGSCKPRILLGGLCGSPSERSCQRGLVCADSKCSTSLADGGTCGANAEWVCTTPVALGGNCLGDFECSWGFTCINGRCLQAKKGGEACSGRLDCAPDQDLSCAPKVTGGDSVCMAITRSTLGDSCNEGKGIYCIGGTMCRGTDGQPASVGVCGSLGEDGSACAGTMDCPYLTLCVGGKCESAATASGSCQ